MNALEHMTIETLSMINGKLLGDGNISLEKNRRPRFRFSHSAHDAAWCFYCYEQLNEHLPLTKPKYRKIFDCRVKTNFTEHYYVQSLTTEIVEQLKALWYPQGRKTIPFEFLSDSFTPLCLAWWYQDDGHLKIENHQVKKVILSTDGFAKTENESLMELLHRKHQLRFSLDRQNRLVLYDKPQIVYFLRLIKPHVHESMQRKIVFPFISEKAAKKRTTIYLPKTIRIIRPTRDIHAILKHLPALYDQLCNEHTYKTLFVHMFPMLKMPKDAVQAYQIELTYKHMEYINTCQQLTGLTMSQIVHLCMLAT